MSAKLSRQGSVTYVTFENGKCYRLESVLDRRRDTLSALHLTRAAYLRRLRTYTALILRGFKESG